MSSSMYDPRITPLPEAVVVVLPLVSVLEVAETGCLGAAMYAGIGLGVYSSLDDAVARAVRIKAVYEPIPENYAAYDAAYARFVAGYESLAGGGFFRTLHEQLAS